MLNSNSNLNSDLDAGIDQTGPEVRVLLKQGPADQDQWCFERQFSIGRSSDADIRIKDATVSRVHATVQVIEGKWWIQDMNSSNGILINDQKALKSQVDRQTKLQLGSGGPILELCLDTFDPFDSETIVVDLNEIKKLKNHPFKIEDAVENDTAAGGYMAMIKNLCKFDKTSLQKWRPHTKNWRQNKPLMACLVIAGLLLAGFIALKGPGVSAPSPEISHAVPSQADSQAAQRVKKEEKDGVKNMEGDQANGKSDASGPNAASRPMGGEKEKTNVPQQDMIQHDTVDIYLNAAEKFSDHQRWQPALEYYQKVAEIKTDHPQLNTKIEKMKFEISNRTAYAQGMAHIKAKRFEQGIAQLHKVAESSVYYHDAEQLIVVAEKMKVQAAEEQKQKEAKALKAAEEQKAADTIDRALQHYADGDTKTSITTLEQVISNSSRVKGDLKQRAETLKKQIAKARSLYDKGNQAYKRKKIKTALSAWNKLIEADQELLGAKSSHFSKSVSTKMADEYGAMARRFYADGDFPTAYKYSKSALDRKMDHPQALQVKQMLKAISKQIYQSGYVIEVYNPEKARKKWKEVLKICDPDTEYYQKAFTQVNG